MILINRDKAEKISLNNLRAVRDERLAALDLVYLRALEAGKDTAEISIERQKLRDVTGKDFSALSLDELSRLTLDTALAL